MHARVHSTVRWAPAARESSPPLQRLFSAPACRSITACAVVVAIHSNICQVGEPPEKVVGVSIRLLLSGAKGRGEGLRLAGWLAALRLSLRRLRLWIDACPGVRWAPFVGRASTDRRGRELRGCKHRGVGAESFRAIFGSVAVGIGV